MTLPINLFKWSIDGWQSGLPPKSGEFLVRFEPDGVPMRLTVTLVSAGDEPFAVWRHHDLSEEHPFVLPDGATWMCQHGDIISIHWHSIAAAVSEVVCGNCGAIGAVKSKAELQAEIEALRKKRDALYGGPRYTRAGVYGDE